MASHNQTSEPIVFERDCLAVMVPQGRSDPARGPERHISRRSAAVSLCSSTAIFPYPRCRCRRHRQGTSRTIDPDAEADDAEVETGMATARTRVMTEIPVNVVDLGLVYECTEKMKTIRGG
jgi:hypothetical protein